MKLIWALVAFGFVFTLVVWPQIKRVNHETTSDKQRAHERLMRELSRHE